MGKKFIVLDIRAEDESGEQLDVEMQVRKYESYSKRSLFYLCKLYSEQLDSGKDYGELKPVVGIHFLDYEQFPECPDFRYRFVFNDSLHPEICLTEDMVLHVIELPTFERMSENTEQNTFSEWVRFISRADSETEETMRENYSNPNVLKAYHALESLSEDEKARLRTEMRERALRNEISELNAAERKGKREGKLEGKREGKREGRLEGMTEMIIENLNVRFQDVPDSIKKRLAAVVELEKLKTIQRSSLSADSFGEFETLLDSIL
jgi:predicted transposase/invertase (TIGR01784 family)